MVFCILVLLAIKKKQEYWAVINSLQGEKGKICYKFSANPKHNESK